jgi:hypothetical protein
LTLVPAEAKGDDTLLAGLDFAALGVLVDQIDVLWNIDGNKAAEELTRAAQIGRCIPFISNNNATLSEGLSLFATDKFNLRVSRLDNQVRLCSRRLRKNGNACGGTHSHKRLL